MSKATTFNLIIAIGMIAFVALVTAFSLYINLGSVQEERDVVKHQYAQLKEKNDAIVAEKKILEDDIAEIYKQNVLIGDLNTELTSENESLKQALASSVNANVDVDVDALLESFLGKK